MRVAIMQPTYLPWLGYLGLMDAVDLFIILDTVQFDKRSWQQRNKIKTANGPLWLSVPVFNKGRREQLIRDVEIDFTQDFPRSHLKTLEMNYRKSAYFETISPDIFEILSAKKKNLAELNIDLIFWIREVLGITTPIRFASEFDLDGTKADLLASLCEKVGASEYVSPPGSKGYLDESDAFIRRNIPLFYYDFRHPEYPQRYGQFLSNMSVIDLLFNCGAASISIIKNASKISA